MTDKTRDELLLAMANAIEAVVGKGTDDISKEDDKRLIGAIWKAGKEQVTNAVRTNHCRCPECGNTDVDYDSAIYDHDEGCCMLFTCRNCGAEVKEVYKTTYLRSEVYGHTKENKHGT